jgi:hypothetical protein
LIKSYDAGRRLKADQFGYSSAHLVVGLPDSWLAVPTLASFGHLKAELQVRTLAQHMWAEASQVLQYKREDSAPPTVLRGLYRGSALLELLDLEFERILGERAAYREGLDVEASADVLNVDNLEKVLDSVLPVESKSPDEPYANVLRELRHFGIDTSGKLRAFVEANLEAAVAEDRERIKVEQGRLSRGEKVVGSSEERVRRGLYYSYAGHVRNMLRYQFGDHALTAVMKARRKRRKG